MKTRTRFAPVVVIAIALLIISFPKTAVAAVKQEPLRIFVAAHQNGLFIDPDQRDSVRDLINALLESKDVFHVIESKETADLILTVLGRGMGGTFAQKDSPMLEVVQNPEWAWLRTVVAIGEYHREYGASSKPDDFGAVWKGLAYNVVNDLKRWVVANRDSLIAKRRSAAVGQDSLRGGQGFRLQHQHGLNDHDGTLAVSAGRIEWHELVADSSNDSFVTSCSDVKDTGTNSPLGLHARMGEQMLHVRLSEKNYNFASVDATAQAVVRAIKDACGRK